MGASVDFELSSTQYIDIGALMDGDNNLTFSCWANFESLPASAPRPCVAGFGAFSAVFLVNSSIVILGYSEKFMSMPHSFSTGIWNHLAWTYNGNGNMLTGSKGYINGVEQTLSDVFKSTEDPGTIDTTSTSFKIGNRGNSSDFMDGQVAYLQAYNEVLDINEINEILHKPGSVTSGLQAFWPLLGSSTEFIKDISGNGWDGTNNSSTESFDGPAVQFY